MESLEITQQEPVCEVGYVESQSVEATEKAGALTEREEARLQQSLNQAARLRILQQVFTWVGIGLGLILATLLFADILREALPRNSIVIWFFQNVLRLYPFTTVNVHPDGTAVTYVSTISNALVGLGCMISSATAFWLRRRNHAHLAQFDDVRAVGPLTESRNGAAALKELLPRLKAGDAPLLNKGQRSRLHAMLEGGDEDLSIAILKAFEQVGDETDLTVVEKLVDNKRLRNRKQIVEAAEACLEYLRQRVELERQRQTLLRPTDYDVDGRASLLRPARGTSYSLPPRTD